MKIAVLSPIHWRTPPERYGPWELVASLITEELVRRGHDVTLFASGDSITAGRLRSICPHPLFSEAGKQLETRSYEYLHSALPFEAADEFDVIHNHYNVYPLVFSKLVTTPVVTTMHGFSSPGVVKIMEIYSNTSFVSISEADRRHAPHIPWLATVHHGLRLEDFAFVETPQDYLCYVGRISPDKGVHLAVQAAITAGKPLKIAGLMENESYFKKEIAPYLMPGKVEYVGEIEEKEKKELLAHAQALLHLNTYAEGFGLTLIESMASGTPVIGMQRGSVPEVVADGQTGFIVDGVPQAVEAIGKLATITRQDCRKRVEQHFTVERMVDKYEQVYQRVLTK